MNPRIFFFFLIIALILASVFVWLVPILKRFGKNSNKLYSDLDKYMSKKRK